MRKRLLSVLIALPLLLCACERETLTDPVLFCESYNRIAPQPISETDAYLRSENEFLLFTGETLIRLKTNEDGAIHTAVVTGKGSDETASVAQYAFTALAQPFSEAVPQSVTAQCTQQSLSVWTAETKRFYYAVYRDEESVTIVQTNRQLSSIPVLPSLRPSESE